MDFCFVFFYSRLSITYACDFPSAFFSLHWGNLRSQQAYTLNWQTVDNWKWVKTFKKEFDMTAGLLSGRTKLIMVQRKEMSRILGISYRNPEDSGQATSKENICAKAVLATGWNDVYWTIRDFGASALSYSRNHSTRVCPPSCFLSFCRSPHLEEAGGGSFCFSFSLFLLTAHLSSPTGDAELQCAMGLVYWLHTTWSSGLLILTANIWDTTMLKKIKS